MGACNCGFLTQELTTLSKKEIHQYAMMGRGDWTEQVEAFCPTSKLPMDLLISELIGFGLTLEDLINLERLKDKEVLSRISRPLQHNKKDDVTLYLTFWSEILLEKLQKRESKSLVTEPS